MTGINTSQIFMAKKKPDTIKTLQEIPGPATVFQALEPAPPVEVFASVVRLHNGREVSLTGTKDDVVGVVQFLRGNGFAQ